jgi:hypothetical protein
MRILSVLLAASLLSASVVAARDNGQFAQSPLKKWFDSLQSKKGFCCSDADGVATNYEIREGSYWAPLDGVMTRVPDEAVITEPNLKGEAMKWIYHEQGKPAFRCFLPAGGV